MTKPKRPSVLSLTGIRLKESRGEALGSLWQWYIGYRACQELAAASVQGSQAESNTNPRRCSSARHATPTPRCPSKLPLQIQTLLNPPHSPRTAPSCPRTHSHALLLPPHAALQVSQILHSLCTPNAAVQ